MDFYFILSTKTKQTINGTIKNDIFLNGNIKLVGTTNDSFIYVIHDPWHMKLSDSGKILLSQQDQEFISTINEDTDYILFGLKLKSNNPEQKKVF